MRCHVLPGRGFLALGSRVLGRGSGLEAPLWGRSRRFHPRLQHVTGSPRFRPRLQHEWGWLPREQPRACGSCAGAWTCGEVPLLRGARAARARGEDGPSAGRATRAPQEADGRGRAVTCHRDAWPPSPHGHVQAAAGRAPVRAAMGQRRGLPSRPRRTSGPPAVERRGRIGAAGGPCRVPACGDGARWPRTPAGPEGLAVRGRAPDPEVRDGSASCSPRSAAGDAFPSRFRGSYRCSPRPGRPCLLRSRDFLLETPRSNVRPGVSAVPRPE